MTVSYLKSDAKIVVEQNTNVYPKCDLVSLQAVETLKPDGYQPTIIKETPEYLYVEYKAPSFGFIDDGRLYAIHSSHNIFLKRYINSIAIHLLW